jgi:CubicO group peptidase (beta-lactamase class C family)
VGRSVDEFARDVLFQPLGITEWHWLRDVSGHTKGQGNLVLTARDFAKIGQMVLDCGVYDGRRVLSEQWISESLMPRVAIYTVDPYAEGYGYFWYSKSHQIGKEQVLIYFASGNGGNKIYIVPSRGLVIAITSSAYRRGYGLLPSLFELKVGNFYIQLASENDRDGVLKLIKEHAKAGHRIFVGVIDPINPRVETPEEVRDRVLI